MRLLPLLLILLAAHGGAQDLVAPAQPSKFRIGVNASFEQLNRRVGYYYDIEHAEREARNIQNATYGGGVSANIRVGYALGRKVDLEGGLGYVYRQFAVDWSRLVFSPSSGFIPFQSHDRLHNSTELHYADLPVRLTYTVGSGPLRWISSIGISTSILFAHMHNETPAHRDLQVADPKRVHIAPSASTGLAFSLSDRSDLRLEPTFMYGITPLTDRWVRNNMWSYGVELGYYRRF